MPSAIPSPSAMATWKKSDLSMFGTAFPTWLAFPSMRLGRLTADAAIAFDGDVDVAFRNRLLAPPGCCPAAPTRLPASIFATRRFAPGPSTEATLPAIR